MLLGTTSASYFIIFQVEKQVQGDGVKDRSGAGGTACGHDTPSLSFGLFFHLNPTLTC